MKAVISSTYDDKYLFYLPIVTWCWNKLGVDVICFVPGNVYNKDVGKNILTLSRVSLINKIIDGNKLAAKFFTFICPEHKEATYAQCSRIYAAAIKELPEDEVLITSDVDMIVFGGEVLQEPGEMMFDIYGADLVPDKQFPMCYVSAKVKTWRAITGGGTYQEKLDNLLGGIECENMRGNYWGKDQETIYNLITENNDVDFIKHNRSNGQNQFATKRYDRDDAYVLDRLNPDTLDYHLPRPGYEENNFNQILAVLKYHYPNDNFDWLVEYRNEYLKIL